jgi:hypothetical protein
MRTVYYQAKGRDETLRNRAWMSLKASPAVLAAFLFLAGSIHAQCPSYTMKSDVKTGRVADLPDGYIVYAKDSTNGLFRTPVRQFSETLIQGTQSDRPYSLDISDDGNWVVYTHCFDSSITARTRMTLIRNVYVVNIQTGNRTEVPVQTFKAPLQSTTPRDSFLIYPYQVGFLHNSPRGNEIYYYYSYWGTTAKQGDQKIRALQVDLSGNAPVFGSARVLMDFTGTSKRSIWPYAGIIVARVVKDHIFAPLTAFTDTYTYTALHNDYITIPDNGLGIAKPENLYTWTDETEENLFGCAQSVSYGGSLCLTNASMIGDSCVPSSATDPDYGHKGFYITPFFRKGIDPPMKLNDQALVNGVSINWCPAEYRFGDHGTVDFADWNFSNDSNYVVGMLRGKLAPVWGLWVVEWKTNTWTLISPAEKKVVYVRPVMRITGKMAVAHAYSGLRAEKNTFATTRIAIRRREIDRISQGSATRLYTLQGELLGTSFSDVTSRGPCIVDVKPRF